MCGGTGRRAVTVVPPPTGLTTDNVPPPASNLSMRPVSPDPPAGSAPPMPSSVTTIRSSSLAPLMLAVIATPVALACLTALKVRVHFPGILALNGAEA